MWKRRTVEILLLLAIGFVAIVLWLRWNEPRMLYYPIREMEATPATLGLKYEDLTLTASDGIRINAWFLPAAPSPLTNLPPRTTVLFFHGNAGNIADRFEKLDVLHSLGADVLIIDYRGYGRSEGKPNEAGTYHDAQAAYVYLTKTLNREPKTVVVYGESLGSAVAADLASKVEVGGLVLEEAFTSIPDVGQKMFPFLPVRWLVRNKYDTLSKMPRIHAPVLILHSRDDEFFDIRHAQRLLAAANEPKLFWELTASHNEPVANRRHFIAGMEKFLDMVEAPPAQAAPLVKPAEGP